MGGSDGSACCVPRGRDVATVLAGGVPWGWWAWGSQWAWASQWAWTGPDGHGHLEGHGHPDRHWQLLAGAGISTAASALPEPCCSTLWGCRALKSLPTGCTSKALLQKNASKNADEQRSSWPNSRGNPSDDYSDFLISTETSVLMKCTEAKQPWKCQCKGERPPNGH